MLLSFRAGPLPAPLVDVTSTVVQEACREDYPGYREPPRGDEVKHVAAAQRAALHSVDRREREHDGRAGLEAAPRSTRLIFGYLRTNPTLLMSKVRLA
jgi:hypothetical protein